MIRDDAEYYYRDRCPLERDLEREWEPVEPERPCAQEKGCDPE